MGVSSSLYSSISGLSTMGEAMSVLGDNVANVNTISFKSSRATFQDVLSQTVSTAAGAAQVGRGVTLSTVSGLFAQGSFESSSSPTDMAIGGQGFFMLRTEESAEADMYTRAGEFGFDQDGNLTNPNGYYVQGWAIEEKVSLGGLKSFERVGSVGDIQIGKSTAPVATEAIDVIVNVDSREANEQNELRLFDAWDGTKAAAAIPEDPIEVANYNYTSSIKVYDSKGASHDITVYFDRTSNDNEWEFLATCDPVEDMRLLSDGVDANNAPDGSINELLVYAPDTTYNYRQHKGAGALMYGVLAFDSKGQISTISAYDVPPDGEVDPSLMTNRINLTASDTAFKFRANFTGVTDSAQEQYIKLNFGAKYSGTISNVAQTIVSSGGAYTKATGGDDNVITSETKWSNVYDAGGNQVETGDLMVFNGYDHDGNAVTPLVYTINTTYKVQTLLDQLETSFGCDASIDAKGRLKLIDRTGSESGMFVSNFTTVSVNSSVPFGGTVGGNNSWCETTAAMYDSTVIPLPTLVTSPTTLLVNLEDATGNAFSAGDSITFTGTTIGGAAIPVAGPPNDNVFTEGADGTDIQDILDFIANVYETGDGTTGTGLVKATLTSDGKLRIVDTTLSGNISVEAQYDDAGLTGALPWGIAITPATTTLTPQKGFVGMIDFNTAKRMIVSPDRALSSAGGVPPITDSTNWATVYDTAGEAIESGDTIAFTGTKGDSTVVNATFTVDNVAGNTSNPDSYGSIQGATTGTISDLLTWLEDQFDAEASIDGAGRLVLVDRTGDSTGTYTSGLSISAIAYASGPLPATVPAAEIFGAVSTPFSVIPPDTTEDSSREGGDVSMVFESDALASTQYANSSTTIFQDQNGFASGFLQSVSVDTEGVITGHYSNGQVIPKAQVALANFNNLYGLNKAGGNIYTETTDSGAPVTSAPGTNGLGTIAPNSLEQSNVDLGTEFVKLITTQRGFQANSKIITTTDEMLADLINIKR